MPAGPAGNAGSGTRQPVGRSLGRQGRMPDHSFTQWCGRAACKHHHRIPQPADGTTKPGIQRLYRENDTA